tara:strand:+ start:2550 stop:3158 length:609 start_codon:yes stop_codon:yes gene_type:complete
MAKSATNRQPGAEQILSAALVLIADHPWRGISMEMIAEASGASLTTVYKYYPAKLDLVSGFIERINKRLLAAHDFKDRNEPKRDRLIDVLMRRFELLDPNKRAVRSIIIGSVFDPYSTLSLIPTFTKAMAWSLEAAGLNTSGFAGLVRIKAVSLIYLSTMRVWLKDESEDLSSTLSYLDQSIRRVESILFTFEKIRNSRGRT